MDPRIETLAQILRLNTTLFRNCLDGFTDEMATRRPSNSTNSAAFVASHVTDTRFYLLKLLGVERPNPVEQSLAGARTIADIKQLLPLQQILDAWTSAAHALRERLETITPAELDASIETRFPMADPTILSALAFLVQHDTYHIGQLAMLRKHAGLPAMKYA